MTASIVAVALAMPFGLPALNTQGNVGNLPTAGAEAAQNICTAQAPICYSLDNPNEVATCGLPSYKPCPMQDTCIVPRDNPGKHTQNGTPAKFVRDANGKCTLTCDKPCPSTTLPWQEICDLPDDQLTVDMQDKYPVRSAPTRICCMPLMIVPSGSISHECLSRSIVR